MSFSVRLTILQNFDTIVDNYHSEFCSYYLIAHDLLTSIEIFDQPNRKVLKEMTFILLRLHQGNRNLVSVLVNPC